MMSFTFPVSKLFFAQWLKEIIRWRRDLFFQAAELHLGRTCRNQFSSGNAMPRNDNPLASRHRFKKF